MVYSFWHEQRFSFISNTTMVHRYSTLRRFLKQEILGVIFLNVLASTLDHISQTIRTKFLICFLAIHLTTNAIRLKSSIKIIVLRFN
jgi:hypothetical protein